MEEKDYLMSHDHIDQSLLNANESYIALRSINIYWQTLSKIGDALI